MPGFALSAPLGMTTAPPLLEVVELLRLKGPQIYQELLKMTTTQRINKSFP